MSDVNEKLDDVLKHYGVKGMRWGIRGETRQTRKRYKSYNKGLRLMDRVRLKKITDSDARKQYLDNKDKAWIEKVQNDASIQRVASRTAKRFNKVNKELKEQFGGRGIKGDAIRAFDGSMNAAYRKTMKDAYTEILADQTFAAYKLSPSRIREVNIHPNSDGTFKAVIVERNNPKLSKQRSAISKAAEKAKQREEKATIKHAEDLEEDFETDLNGMVFIVIPDDEGFPDRVVLPFDVDEDVIQQSGVKGMRWGVRRDYSQRGGADGKLDAIDKPIRTSLGKKLNSLKRERQWKHVVRQMDKLSNADIKEATKRIDLENSFKTLSKKIGNKHDKSEYLRRDRMGDEELARKVLRLRLKSNLQKAANEASKEQRELGEKIVQIGGTLGVRYALKQDLKVLDVIKNPKSESDKAIESVKKAAANKGKDILDNLMEKTNKKT